jgi:hypothetical protein
MHNSETVCFSNFFGSSIVGSLGGGVKRIFITPWTLMRERINYPVHFFFGCVAACIPFSIALVFMHRVVGSLQQDI